MPAYAAKMSDQEIADVTTYIRNSWGNAAHPVVPAQVAKARGAEHHSGTVRRIRPRQPNILFSSPPG